MVLYTYFVDSVTQTLSNSGFFSKSMALFKISKKHLFGSPTYDSIIDSLNQIKSYN